MRTREEMSVTVQQFLDRGFNAHDLGYIEGLLSDGFVEHNPYPGLGNDKKGALETFGAIFAATPDIRAEVLDLVVSGNRFAVRTRVTGTDNGTGQMPGVAPTGRSFTAEAIDVVEVGEDGSWLSHYGIFDQPAIMTQLGLMTPPPGAG